MSENCQNLPASSRAESMACLKVGVTSPLHSLSLRKDEGKAHTLVIALLQQLRSVIELVEDVTEGYCSFAYSALASFRMGMSGSASFQRVRKSL